MGNLSTDDFDMIEMDPRPSWRGLGFLVQIAEFEEERWQESHGPDHDHLKCFQYIARRPRSLLRNRETVGLKSNKKTGIRNNRAEGMRKLSSDDFDMIEIDPRPSWCGLGFLLQIAEFEEERWQENHGPDHDHLKCFQCIARRPRSLLRNRETVGLKSNKKTRIPKRKLNEEDDDGEQEHGMKPKPKRSKKRQHLCPMPTPDIPHNFKSYILENMGGSGLVLLIQKTLFFSDVNPTASRFSVPFSQVKTHDFLTGTEAQSLAGKNPMEVRLLDPSMKETTLTFNRWEMSKTKLYVLTKAWNSVVQSNRLEEGNTVQLWSFRVNSELWFVLVKVDVP